jgi:Fe2+ transport system protein B
MAKIRFGDYLKSKKNKRALYESDESIAKRVVTLIESDECAVNPRYRLENFARAIELLEQIPGHPDAAEMMKVCLDGIDEAEDQLVRTDYERAKQHLKTAVDEYEYSKAADELDQLLEEIRDRQDTVREQLKEASQAAEKHSGAEADKPTADGETASENKDNQDNREDSKKTEGSEKTEDSRKAEDSEKTEDSEETEKGEKKKTVEDLQASLSRYDEMLRETEAFKAQADAKVVRFSRKTSGHRWTVLVVFAVIVGAIVYVVSSGLFSYLVASLEGKA